MTVLVALGLIVAFFLMPATTICAAIGAAVAGLPGAVVGGIIGLLFEF